MKTRFKAVWKTAKETVAKHSKAIDHSLNALGTVGAGLYAIGHASTLCVDIPGLKKVQEIVFTLTKWGGGIILVAGIAMVGKSIMDSTSGQGFVMG